MTPYELKKELVKALQDRTGFDFGSLIERSTVPSLTAALAHFKGAGSAPTKTVESDALPDDDTVPQEFVPDTTKFYPYCIIEEKQSRQEDAWRYVRIKIEGTDFTTFDNLWGERERQFRVFNEVKRFSELVGRKGLVKLAVGKKGNLMPAEYKAEKSLSAVK